MPELWCVYTVQGVCDDGLSNAFQVRARAPATLGEVVASFAKARPTSSERFHWRVRSTDPNFGHVWCDVGEADELPAETLGDVSVVYARIVDVSARAVAARLARGPPRGSGNRPTAPPPEPEPVVYEEPPQESLLGDDEPFQQPPQQSFQQPPQQQSFQQAPLQQSFLGEETLLQTEPQRDFSEGLHQLDDDDEMTVEEAVFARKQSLEEAIADKANSTKDEIRKRAEAQARDEEEMQQLRARLGPGLKSWSEEFGKKKNIRALLAGMDKVMWPEANWKPISIADLLEASKVKKAYYKASRYVHPDKLVGLSCEQRYVGQTIFDALSQAYAEFEAS